MPEYLGAQVMIPENDAPNREFFQQQASGRLHLRKCNDCNLLIYPTRTMCPDCRGSDFTWEAVSGKGTVYSYYIIPAPTHPAFIEFAPYPVVLIELDEQRGTPSEHRALRLVGNVVKEDGSFEDGENIAINKRVEVTMVDLGDGMALPQWKLSGEPSEGEEWQIPSTRR